MKIFTPHSRLFLEGKVDTGTLYIITIIIILTGFAYLVTGPSPSQNQLPGGTEVVIAQATPGTNNKTQLQLMTFAAATITPPMSSVCTKGGINTNPEMIIATSPTNGNAVRSDGQLRIWLNDTAPIKVSPGEIVRRSSGFIVTAGDRAAPAPDGYTWEPALYIMPNTIDKAGRAYFPNLIHGIYNNGEFRLAYGADPVPARVKYTDKGSSLEVVWNVKDLGLSLGEHQIQFMAHDGNNGRAIVCITLRVYDPPDLKTALPN